VECAIKKRPCPATSLDRRCRALSSKSQHHLVGARILQGNSSWDIGAILGISETTVVLYVKKTTRKLRRPAERPPQLKPFILVLSPCRMGYLREIRLGSCLTVGSGHKE
jgi:DNA-binding CsgD family transcriptional regulator